MNLTAFGFFFTHEYGFQEKYPYEYYDNNSESRILTLAWRLVGSSSMWSSSELSISNNIPVIFPARSLCWRYKMFELTFKFNLYEFIMIKWEWTIQEEKPGWGGRCALPASASVLALGQRPAWQLSGVPRKRPLSWIPRECLWRPTYRQWTFIRHQPVLAQPRCLAVSRPS